MKTKVLIFDDNNHRVDGLKMLFSVTEDLEFAGAHNDCSHVLEDIEAARPDVVLMDIDMPHVDGIEGVRIIRSKYPDLKILMQTVLEEDNKIISAICAGANGYILKQSSPIKLLEAIKEVLEGGAPMTPAIASKVLVLFNRQGKIFPKHDFDLTQRELEVLDLLSRGYSYKMIADRCFISYATVNTHVSHIYDKLKVNSVAGAVSMALREGLIQ